MSSGLSLSEWTGPYWEDKLEINSDGSSFLKPLFVYIVKVTLALKEKDSPFHLDFSQSEVKLGGK